MLIPLFYSFMSALSTLAGGLLPLFRPWREDSLRYLIAFAAGVMLSVAFWVMLPEIAGESSGNFLALGLGFFSLYIVEKLVLIHSCGEKECEAHTIGWVSLIGIAAESLLDGIAIAAGFALSPQLGLAVTLAVIAHEFPRGLTTSVIMMSSGYKKKVTLGALAVDALLTPVGAGLVLLGLFSGERAFQWLMAFAAGTFIYIGASDLLPEAHKRFNIKVVLCVLLGVVIIPGIELLTGI